MRARYRVYYCNELIDITLAGSEKQAIGIVKASGWTAEKIEEDEQ